MATVEERLATLEQQHAAIRLLYGVHDLELAAAEADIVALEDDLARGYLDLDTRLGIVERLLEGARERLSGLKALLVRGRLPGVRGDVEVQPRLTVAEREAIAWLVQERQRSRSARRSGGAR